MSAQPSAVPASFLSAPGQVVEQTELGFFIDVREQLEARGVYDASRLKAQRPELYQVIARLLASGICGKDEIARLCGVAWESVAAVEADAAPTIREFKSRLSVRLRLAISAAADHLIIQARAGELTAIDFGILVDKLLLIEGEATARVELVEDPAAAAFRQAMAALAPAAMGLVGGFPGKGAAPVIDLEAAAVRVSPVAASDLQGTGQSS